MGRPCTAAAPEPNLLPYFPFVAADSRKPRNDPEDSRLAASRGEMRSESSEDTRRVERPSAKIFPAALPRPFEVQLDRNMPPSGKTSAEPGGETRMERVTSLLPRAEISARNASEHSGNRIHAGEPAPLEQLDAGASLQREQISQVNPVSLSEASKAHAEKTRSMTNENKAGRTKVEPRAPLEESNPATRSQSARTNQVAANGDSVVQVRIGRVEVRVNAPPAPPAPVATQARGPRGFSEYAAMRRYLTRTRI